VGGFGQHDGTKGGILDVEAGSELTATSRNLDDAVGFGIGKCFECGIDRRDGSHVDRRVGIVAFLGGIDHRGVLSRCSYWHGCCGLVLFIYFWIKVSYPYAEYPYMTT